VLLFVLSSNEYLPAYENWFQEVPKCSTSLLPVLPQNSIHGLKSLLPQDTCRIRECHQIRGKCLEKKTPQGAEPGSRRRENSDVELDNTSYLCRRLHALLRFKEPSIMTSVSCHHQSQQILRLVS